jgi:hypothetical protein
MPRVETWHLLAFHASQKLGTCNTHLTAYVYVCTMLGRSTNLTTGGAHMAKSQFTRLLVQAVERKDWSYLDVVEHVGIEASWWYRIRGGTLPGDKTLSKFLRALPEDAAALRAAHSRERIKRARDITSDVGATMRAALSPLSAEQRVELARVLREAEGLPWDIVIQQFASIVGLVREQEKDIAARLRKRMPNGKHKRGG